MNKKIKIILSLVGALFVSSAASNTVFIAGTPQVNMVFVAQVVKSPGLILSNTNEYIAAIFSGKKSDSMVALEKKGEGQDMSFNIASKPQILQNQGYTQTAPGVYQKLDLQEGKLKVEFDSNVTFVGAPEVINGVQGTMYYPVAK
jgi:hypothetical protein